MLIHALVLACCFINTHPIGWAGVNLALAAGDYETAHASQSLALRPACAESNGLFGSQHPTRATFYTRGLLVDGAIEVTGYLIYRAIPKEHRKLRALWMAPFAAVSYSHITGIASNVSCR